MSNKLLTIIITYYERPDHLKLHLHTNQALYFLHEYYDIIILDDNSIQYPLRSYIQNNSNIAYYEHKAVGFFSHSLRNRAVEICNTPWILFLDIDTIFAPAQLLSIINNLIDGMFRDNDFYMFYSYVVEQYIISNNTAPFIGKKKLIDRSNNTITTPFVRNNRKFNVKLHPNVHPNIFLMTRDCFHTTGGYSEELETLREGDGLFFKSIDHDKYKLHVISDCPLYIVNSPIFKKSKFENWRHKINHTVIQQLEEGSFIDKYKNNILIEKIKKL